MKRSVVKNPGIVILEYALDPSSYLLRMTAHIVTLYFALYYNILINEAHIIILYYLLIIPYYL